MINDKTVELFRQILNSLFRSKRFKGSVELMVTDIHVQPVRSDSVVNIFDDDDELLLSEKCEWLQELDGETFYDEFLKLAKLSIGKMKEEGDFCNVNILQPFSFVLIDENKETVNDIDIIDDDTIMLSDELLKGWEEEMDSFINNLLKN